MDYVELQPLSDRPTKHQYEHVKIAITTLHSNVFGDLRQPNILVGGNTVMLVDFDWCGEVGKGRHPPEINLLAGILTWDQIALCLLFVMCTCCTN